ncbi:hypothetical protein [Methylobacterium sp. J-092]|jgi:hypothetical protein|uniref:hypothetical protein n=1 Tax=Methylobacterium sp. J-092 TaxID=2836667 RepID=UPI001FBB4485|nr:hypothetical protein [Methylobacterium sp. J-092]MCJ2009161.1 hypothetical protein [Methylobacterium sp. J-092]
MTRTVLGVCLAFNVLAAAAPTTAAESLVVQQANAKNVLYVIQERSPFHTHSSTLTATTGRTTVTEIVAIGPDPVPLSATQTGFSNRASIYQLGTAPNLDLRQQGSVNVARSQQIAMP